MEEEELMEEEEEVELEDTELWTNSELAASVAKDLRMINHSLRASPPMPP